MGACFSDKVETRQSNNNKTGNNNSGTNNKHNGQNKKQEVKKENTHFKDLDINLYLSQLEDDFKNLPEWEGERYTGLGIKRMKGYKCELKIDELNEKRERFWNSRYNISNIWKHIKHACIVEAGLFF